MKIPIDDNFPEEFANKLASLERYNKHLYRPNTYIHKWWARRCGSTFRLILKNLVKDTTLRDYYTPGGLENTIILDPMMGGGTTLHEAIRLNSKVIGVDIDPIPYLQTKAGLIQLELFSLKNEFNRFFSFIRRSCRHFFITKCPECREEAEIRFILNGQRIECKCGEYTSIDSFIIRYQNDSNIILCQKCGEIYNNIKNHVCKSDNSLFIEKKSKSCNRCKNNYSKLEHLPFRDRYVPICIVGYCQNHGEFYKKPEDYDFKIIEETKKTYLNESFDQSEFVISYGPKTKDLINRNIRSYLDLFTYRQLLILKYSICYIKQISKREIKIMLAILLSTSLEFNSILCGYKGSAKNRPGAIRHVFSHHAFTFPYTAVENNPIYCNSSSGNLISLFNSKIFKSKVWANKPLEKNIKSGQMVEIIGEKDNGNERKSIKDFQSPHDFLLLNQDASYLPIPDNYVDFVVTDPPYYNSVQYSNLSEFFRVWLMRLLPLEANWNIDLSRSAVSNNLDNKKSDYLSVIKSIFLEIKRVINKEHGRLIFTFHHWDPLAWAELTIALKESRFYLINRYIVLSENPISVHINGLNAIKHDTILILSPNKDKSRNNWTNIESINCNDSEFFCRKCGELVGWILNSDLKDDDIYELWKHAIGSRITIDDNNIEHELEPTLETQS